MQRTNIPSTDALSSPSEASRAAAGARRPELAAGGAAPPIPWAEDESGEIAFVKTGSAIDRQAGWPG